MMWYRVGSRDEVPGSTGMAHFLEHLMFKGTRHLKKGDIDTMADDLLLSMLFNACRHVRPELSTKKHHRKSA